MAKEIISIREFARRKNLSEGYIRRMIDNGVITAKSMTRKKNGHPAIIAERAEADWTINYHATRPAPNKPEVEDAAPPMEIRRSVIKQVAETGVVPENRKTKQELDRIHAELKIQLTAIQLKERKAVLVEQGLVYRAMFEIGQELRRDIMSLPDKILDNIRGADTRAEAYAIMYNGLTDALKSISEMTEDSIKIKAR